MSSGLGEFHSEIATTVGRFARLSTDGAHNYSGLGEFHSEIATTVDRVARLSTDGAHNYLPAPNTPLPACCFPGSPGATVGLLAATQSIERAQLSLCAN